MNATELLEQLRQRDIRVSLVAERLRVDAPPGAVTPELRASIGVNRAELIAHLSAGLPSCPRCCLTDYLPLSDGWRRCWVCGCRWGPSGSPDPGYPPGLADVAHLLGLRRRRRASGG